MNYQALSLNNMYMQYEGGEERRNTDHTLFYCWLYRNKTMRLYV